MIAHFFSSIFSLFFWKATRLMKKFRFSFIFFVNIFPTTRFFLVLATILTHKNLQLKKSSKTYFFHIHLTGINQLICLCICLILCSWLILVELIDLVNYVIIFLIIISNNLTLRVNFPSRIPDCGFHNPPLLDIFLSSDPIVCFIVTFPT